MRPRGECLHGEFLPVTDDDEPTPPRVRLVPPPKRRLQSATERETESEAARRARAIPEFVTEANTGVLERRRKSYSERLERVEQRHDEADVALAEIGGELKAQSVILGELHDDMKARRADDASAKLNRRERVTALIKGGLGTGAVLEIIHRFFL